MRTEIGGKPSSALRTGRLAHTLVILSAALQIRHGKTFQRPRRQDRADGRVFAIELVASGEGGAA